MQKLNFKYHNVQLPGGLLTVPGKQLLVEEYKFRKIKEHLEFLYPIPFERKSVTLLDVGALEGGYSILFAKMGFKVTLIEPREENMAMCQLMMELNGITGVEFLQMDARCLEVLDPIRKWDIIVCAGLLYHLDNPVWMFKLLKDLTNEVLIVSTHFSRPYDKRYDNGRFISKWERRFYKYFKLFFESARYNLSELQINENWPGRWFLEHKPFATEYEIQQSRQASLNNSRSFWLTRESLFEIAGNAVELAQNPFEDIIVFACQTKRLNQNTAE